MKFTILSSSNIVQFLVYFGLIFIFAGCVRGLIKGEIGLNSGVAGGPNSIKGFTAQIISLIVGLFILYCLRLAMATGNFNVKIFLAGLIVAILAMFVTRGKYIKLGFRVK